MTEQEGGFNPEEAKEREFNLRYAGVVEKIFHLDLNTVPEEDDEKENQRAVLNQIREDPTRLTNLVTELEELISRLSPMEQTVIKKTHGLESLDSKKQSIPEISTDVDRVKLQVSRVLSKAENKLRALLKRRDIFQTP